MKQHDINLLIFATIFFFIPITAHKKNKTRPVHHNKGPEHFSIGSDGQNVQIVQKDTLEGC